MLRIILCCALLLCLCPTSLAQTTSEVEAAREAAKRHNESVESAQERLEREIARAKADHAKAVIMAKDRMIEDLRRAFRTAMRSDAPENSVKIAEQIKRLEKQIASLKVKSEPRQAEKTQSNVEVKLKGLDPRLVGVLYIHGTRDDGTKHGRAYEISPAGKLHVIYDLSGNSEGIDVGSLYQGVIRGDEFVVHFTDWTFKGYTQGRMQAFIITDDGRVRLRHGGLEGFEKTGGLTRFFNYKQSHFESVDAFKAFVRGDDVPENDVPTQRPDVAEPDDQPVDVEDTGADAASEDEAVDFFGIPIK